MNGPRITPATLKGFRDYLPDTMLVREELIDTARQVYRSFGFSPIDTPSLEYSEILLGKGGDESDKQLFRFTDQGNRDVAMRFDLTVPLARFAAQHLQQIGTPFKRYQVGTVWRAEKPQKGRFREFVQCDFDTIGTESNVADIETLFVIHDLMDRLGFSHFTIRINNRLVLNGLLETLDLTNHATSLLRSLDKLEKIGREKVSQEMQSVGGLTAEQTDRVLNLTDCQGTPVEILNTLEPQVASSESGQEGLMRLRQLFDACQSAGLPSERIVFDPAIARGLDYYTGTIYETFLDDLPGIGSVCSGGRYDDLAELFSSQRLPGVGASLGLDRLLAAMLDLDLAGEAKSSARILVTQFDAAHTMDYLSLARHLREAGLACEVFLEPRPLGKQLKYANRRGFRVAVIAGADEFTEGLWMIKNLATGDQQRVTPEDLVSTIRDCLD